MKRKQSFVHIEHGIKSMLFIFFLISAPLVYGHPADTLQSTIEKYNAYHDENYLERIIIRLDKDFYLSGEYLRFSISCLDASSGHISPLSKVAYIELLGSDQTAVLQAKILLEEGRGYGEFFLPLNLESGNYILRGYTSWMKNYRAELYHHKTVCIINPFVNPTLGPEPGPETAEVRFFPEGGNLVYGIPAKVGFRVVDAYGNGIEFKGKIMDDTGYESLTFSADKEAIGTFNFTPEAYRIYHAILMFSDSTILEAPLPPISKNGIGLRVNNLDTEKLVVEVLSTGPVQGGPIYLIGHSSGKIYFKEVIRLSEGIEQVTLDKVHIDPGIMQITLFDANAAVISQRPVFIHPEITIDVDVTTNKEKYVNREKVTLKITTDDAHAEPVQADLSVSVSLYNDQFEKHDQNMKMAMFLNNESLNSIKDPDFYLDGKSEAARQAMDDLILTLNYDTFLWDDLTTEKNEKTYLPELRNHIITGSLMDWRSRSGVDGIPVYLSTLSENSNFFTTRSQDNGKLYFEINNFFGHNEIVVQTNNAIDSTFQIKIDNPFSADYAPFKTTAFDINRDVQSFIENASRNMQVQHAYIKYRPPSHITSTTDTSTFYEPDAIYYLDDYTRFPVMEEVFREYISGVYVRRNSEGYYFRILDVSRTETFKENPLILLDGLPVFNASDIIDLNPLSIKKIETVRRRFLKGVNLFNGIVSLYSYESDRGGYTPDVKALRMTYEGLQPLRSYPGPSYDGITEEEQRMPDYRNVLYWEPRIKMDEKGSITLEFFTSDTEGLYKIEVEGISPQGVPVSGSAFFEVGSAPAR